MMKKHLASPMLVLIVLSILLSACSTSANPGDPTATPESFFPATAEATGAALLPINPTPTPNLNNPNPVRITEIEYFQDGSQLTVMAKLFNSLDDAILRDVQLEVLALDALGNRVALERSSFRYLFPAETTALVQDFHLISGIEITNVEVRVIDGLIDRSLKYKQPLTVSQTTAFPLENGWNVTGWLKNSDPYTYTQVVLNAIAYNAAGQIIGGGSEVYYFVPEKDEFGFNIPIISLPDQAVARVDISPWITSYSASLPGGNWWNSIEKVEWNFAVDRYNRITGGAILKNITDQTMVETYAILTVSDENNRVCYADHTYYDLIWPKETVSYAVFPNQLPEDCLASNVDLVIVPGEFASFPVEYNPLVVSQAAFVDEDNVSLSVVNNLNSSISQARVYVVIRNSEGRIVGGGFQVSEDIRSASATGVVIPVAYLGDQSELSIFAFATLPADVQFGQ